MDAAGALNWLNAIPDLTFGGAAGPAYSGSGAVVTGAQTITVGGVSLGGSGGVNAEVSAPADSQSTPGSLPATGALSGAGDLLPVGLALLGVFLLRSVFRA